MTDNDAASDALRALEARADRFRRTGEPAAVLAPDVIADAARVLRRLADEMRAPGRRPADPGLLSAVPVLAWLHRWRAQAGPADRSDHEFTVAALLFGLGFGGSAGDTPPEITAWLEREQAEYGQSTFWILRANVLARQAEHTGDAEALEIAIFVLRWMLLASPDGDADRGMRLTTLAEALRARGDAFGDLASFDEAIQAAREAVATTGDEHPNRSDILGVLGAALLTRFEHLGGDSMLTEAIQVLREAVRCATPGEISYTGWQSRLGDGLRQLFLRTADPAAIDEAVEACRAAWRQSRMEDPIHSLVVMRFAAALMIRRIVSHRAADRDELVRVLRQECAAIPPEDPYRSDLLLMLAQALEPPGDQEPESGPSAEAAGDVIELMREAIATSHPSKPTYAALLANTSNLLRSRFERSEDDADLDEAIETGRRALSAAPPGHPFRGMCLVYLGLALAERLTGRGAATGPDPGSALRDEVVRLLTEALTLLPRGDPVRVVAATTLAGEARAEARQSGDLAALDAGIAALGEEVSVLPPASSVYCGQLAQLAEALRARFEASSDTQYLAAALQVSARAVASASPDNPRRAQVMFGAALVRMISFEYTGDTAGLDEGIAMLRDLAAAPGSSSAADPAVLTALALALRYRFEHSGDGADLAESVRTARAAVELSSEPEYLSNLGIVLHAAYEPSGDDALLAEAIEVLRRAADQAGAVGWYRAAVHSNLGDALVTAYTRGGDAGLLNEAIRHNRQAVAETPAGSARRADLFSNLGHALAARFERVGDAADLTEAVSAYRAALSAAPPGHHRRGVHAGNLGTTLWMGFMRAEPALRGSAVSPDELSQLDEIITYLRAGVDAMDPGHMRRNTTLANLANALLARHERSPDPALAAQAVALYREILATAPADHEGRPMWTGGLGNALQVQYRSDRNPDHLDEALRALRAAVAASGEGSRSLALALHNLGVTLGVALDLADDTQDGVAGDGPGGAGRQAVATEAMAVLHRAVAIPTASASLRVRAAVEWGRIAAGQELWAEALEAYGRAVALMPRVAARELQRGDQELGLLSLTSVAADAAACALECADPARAVEVLEHGRGVLLARALESRTDVTDLREQHPDLARRLEELRAALDDEPAAAASGGAILEPVPAARPEEGWRHEAAREWDELVARIATLPGFSRFLEPPPLEDLRAAARSGPVVVFNTSSYRCDAIVLTADDLVVVPLPGLTTRGLLPRAAGFLRALELARGAAMLEERAAAGADLRDVLGWLWDVAAEPVLNALGITAAAADGTPPPRVWWCPTGALSLLPVHAAGRPGVPGASVLDRVVSSYTPTLRALARAHTGGTEPGTGRPVVVALPHTPGQADLPKVDAEARGLAERFLGALLLRGTEATPAKVVAALPDHPWAHFACHAHGDLLASSGSFLQLHEGTLSLVDISRLQLAQAEMAFLSACSTAASSVALPDEAIHLASAFQLAGYRHVIATLWSVHDDIAAAVADEFYQGLGSGPGGPELQSAALALHQAVRHQRASYLRTPSLWAAHVHVGP